MKTVVTMSSEGQIVIPKALRKQLGIDKGSSFTLSGMGDRLILKKAGESTLHKSKGTTGKLLLRFAGSIKSDDIQAMKQAIEDGCERVNPDDWQISP